MNMLSSLIKYIGSLFSMILLSGCAAMNTSFTCHTSSGGGCQSLDQVNHGVDQNMLTPLNTHRASTKTENISKRNYFEGYPGTEITNKPILYGNTVQRIWIAPYIDADNNYHDPSVVYTVLKTNHWIDHAVDTELR